MQPKSIVINMYSLGTKIGNVILKFIIEVKHSFGKFINTINTNFKINILL